MAASMGASMAHNYDTHQSTSPISLLNFQPRRGSFTAPREMTSKTDGGSEGTIDIKETDGIFRNRFFVLDINLMNLIYYSDCTKIESDEETHVSKYIIQVDQLGSIDIKYITKVSRTLTSNGSFQFEVNTSREKYLLSSDSEANRDFWVYVLNRAASFPANQRNSYLKSTSMNDLTTQKKHGYQTAVFGGMVLKTPIRTTNSLEERWKDGVSYMEGWCWKQGAVVKNWKKRYFRMNDVSLSYYETKTVLKDPIRTVLVKDIKNVRVLQKYCQRKNLLEVETPKRKFYMQPEVMEDLQRWKETMEKYLMNSRFYLPRTKSV